MVSPTVTPTPPAMAQPSDSSTSTMLSPPTATTYTTSWHTTSMKPSPPSSQATSIPTTCGGPTPTRHPLAGAMHLPNGPTPRDSPASTHLAALHGSTPPSKTTLPPLTSSSPMWPPYSWDRPEILRSLRGPGPSPITPPSLSYCTCSPASPSSLPQHRAATPPTLTKKMPGLPPSPTPSTPSEPHTQATKWYIHTHNGSSLSIQIITPYANHLWLPRNSRTPCNSLTLPWMKPAIPPSSHTMPPTLEEPAGRTTNARRHT